jgi:hypothetical protein
VESLLLAAIHFHLPLLPIDYPVFQDATAGVEFQLHLAIAAFVRTAGREYLNYQLGRRMEVPSLVKCRGQALVADPHHIRGHVIIVSKDHPRRLQRDANVGLIAPHTERDVELGTGILMMIPRLSRYVELSVDNLIALAVVW